MCQSVSREEELKKIAAKWGLIHDETAPFSLVLSDTCLALYKKDEPKLGGVYVDWVAGASAHRRKFGGGKGQSIAKAIGLTKGVIPKVIDATAGLGRDAFVLASLGCKVQMIERHPVVAALLDDGLTRAKKDPEIGAWVSERLSLLHASSLNMLLDRQNRGEAQDPSIVENSGCDNYLPVTKNEGADVIYLDPMYPHKKKSALVKKEMRVFQTLVGADEDADALLCPALSLAAKRVVVKRPQYADFLAGHAPTMQISTKKNRFDVYVKAAMK